MAASAVIDNLDRLFSAATVAADADADAVGISPPSRGGGGEEGHGQEAQTLAQAQRQEAQTQAQAQTQTHQTQTQTQTHAQEMVALDRFIDSEIRERVGAPNMTWRKLEACFKWRALQEFMAARGIASDSSEFMQVRGLLQERLLDSVDYDPGAQKIRRINHAASDVCVALDSLSCR